MNKRFHFTSALGLLFLYLNSYQVAGLDIDGCVIEPFTVCGGTNPSNADLNGANLLGAVLANANLSGANLSGASLLNANLAGANLGGANVSGAALTGASYDYKTIFTTGFDPRSAGLGFRDKPATP